MLNMLLHLIIKYSFHNSLHLFAKYAFAQTRRHQATLINIKNMASLLH